MADLREIVQEMYGAFGRGDVASILARLDDDVVWESEAPAIVSFAGIRHGKAETKGFFDAIGADHIDPKLTIDEIISSGETVMAIGRYVTTLRATGTRVDSPIAHYWKFRDGKVVRYIGFSNTGAVLEALQATGASATA